MVFKLFVHLFKKYGCEIIVMSEVGSEDIFEEIISILHCYSMKLYSKKRINKIQIAIYLSFKKVYNLIIVKDLVI